MSKFFINATKNLKLKSFSNSSDADINQIISYKYQKKSCKSKRSKSNSQIAKKLKKAKSEILNLNIKGHPLNVLYSQQ